MAINIKTKELRNLLESTPPSHNIMHSGKHSIGKSKIITDYFTAKNQKVHLLSYLYGYDDRGINRDL